MSKFQSRISKEDGIFFIFRFFRKKRPYFSIFDRQYPPQRVALNNSLPAELKYTSSKVMNEAYYDGRDGTYNHNSQPSVATEILDLRGKLFGNIG